MSQWPFVVKSHMSSLKIDYLRTLQFELTETKTLPSAGSERGSSDLPVFKNATEISREGSAHVTMLISPR